MTGLGQIVATVTRIVNDPDATPSLRRTRLVGMVAHHTVRAEGATSRAEAYEHIEAAEVVLEGLRNLRSAYGDTSTDSCGRMAKHIDEIRTAVARKWARRP